MNMHNPLELDLDKKIHAHFICFRRLGMLTNLMLLLHWNYMIWNNIVVYLAT